MDVTRLVSQPLDVNVYVVRDGNEAIVVDTGMGQDLATLVPRIRRALGNARATRIFVTHPHCDHCAACAALRRELGCPVSIHADDAGILEAGDARATLGVFLGVGQEPCPVEPVPTGGVLRVGDARFEVLRLPGHTPNHGALWDRDSGTLFSGDVVFAQGSFGRVDFPGGDGAALVASLKRVAALPLERVYPGHMQPIEAKAREAVEESLANAETMLG